MTKPMATNTRNSPGNTPSVRSVAVLGSSKSRVDAFAHALGNALSFVHMDLEDFDDAMPLALALKQLEETGARQRGIVLSFANTALPDKPTLRFDLAVFIGDPESDGPQTAQIPQLPAMPACPVFFLAGDEDPQLAASSLSRRLSKVSGIEGPLPLGEAKGPVNAPMSVLVFARCRGQWIYVRRKDSLSWEPSGGDLKPSNPAQSPIQAARRMLETQTGALVKEIFEAFDCRIDPGMDMPCSRVFFAEVEGYGEIADTEIAEIRLFPSVPSLAECESAVRGTYELLQRHLVSRSNPDELWDVYDGDRNLTGRVTRRGDPLARGELHLVVHVWVMNRRGEFLITRRAPTKNYPLMWETTGGAAASGEDSLTAALRESGEETGLALEAGAGEVVLSRKREHDFCDVWLFVCDFYLESLALQESETVDAMVAGEDLIREMVADGSFIAFDYMDEFFLIAAARHADLLQSGSDI